MKITKENTPASPKDFYALMWKGACAFLGKPDGELIAISQAHGIFQRAIERGRLPRADIPESQEKKDGIWMQVKRRAKAGYIDNLTWYPKLDEIASQYGFRGAFDDIKKRTLDKAHVIFKRAKTRGRLPDKDSGDSVECMDDNWIKSHRQAKKGTGGSTWYPELDSIPPEYGFFNVFDTTCWKTHNINNAHEIFKRAKIRGKLPSESSKDEQEKKDARWILSQRQRKIGTSPRPWYPELDDVPKQYGFNGNVFDPNNLKQEAIDNAHGVFRRAKKRGKLPNKRSKDEQEKSDGYWIKIKRRAKSGGHGIWYPELDEIAKQYGFSSCIFDPVNRKRGEENKAHEIFQRSKVRGKLPSYHSENKQEKKDAKWISTKRRAKSGKNHKTWYPELDDIAVQYGFPNVFDKQR